MVGYVESRGGEGWLKFTFFFLDVIGLKIYFQENTSIDLDVKSMFQISLFMMTSKQFHICWEMHAI